MSQGARAMRKCVSLRDVLAGVQVTHVWDPRQSAQDCCLANPATSTRWALALMLMGNSLIRCSKGRTEHATAFSCVMELRRQQGVTWGMEALRRLLRHRQREVQQK
jgi:hypothetical protein